MRRRLDVELVKLQLVTSRSQAENWIRLGEVTVNGKVVTKPGYEVHDGPVIELKTKQQYVSRAGLKLASVAELFAVDFADKIVLDIGSSTGGFTDYALQRRTKKVFAVDVGTDQLHPSLRNDERIELHEKTDIRHVFSGQDGAVGSALSKPIVVDVPDIIVCDVSFISLRDILPHVAKNLMGPKTQLLAMLKPQFEAGKGQTNKGIIKNNSVRRRILADFEAWAQQHFIIKDKRDSQVAGAKGNVERFYLLQLAK